MRIVLLLLMLLCVESVFAQSGDRPGETQTPPMREADIPPAPILSPAESMKAIKLAPGFKIELVASEPLIEAPIAMAFHPNGSLYVLEMRGFMPNVDGKGEDQKIGRVSVLTDTDGDGRMDKSTVFLDELVMPRALALVYDGLLVAEPPHLFFCRDTNGDGVSDQKTVVSTSYGSQANPEHTANGLLWGMDNWIYSANYTNKFKRVDGQWISAPSAVVSGRGQWGIAQDDFGRLVFNSNSDYLRGDLVSPDLLFRNPNFTTPYGANVQFDKNQAVFAARPNPGVNRGYQKNELRPDGTLANFTAACGPVIYRGDQFEQSYYGSAFVCEPSANVVRFSRLAETNGVITATNAFPNTEFLASTEERFRPVNLYNGPDGTLYVVDMHRGHLQHRIYVTTYLRNQILARGLSEPLNQGRIYRVVQEGRPRRKIEPLPTQPIPSLVAGLSHANGWQRETSQRLLVESGEVAAVPTLNLLAQANGPEATALHALWTLDGMGKLTPEVIDGSLRSKNPRTRATAVRLAADRAVTNSLLREALIETARDTNSFVQLHSALSLGLLRGDKPALNALAGIIEAHAAERLYTDAALSTLHGQEAAFAELLMQRPAWNEKPPGAERFLATLAHAASVDRSPNSINKILELAAADQSWRRGALLDGILDSPQPARRNRNTPAPKPKTIRLPSEPAALAKLRGQKESAEKVAAIDAMLAWPGKEGAQEATVRPLTVAEKEQFEFGKQTYLLTCAACHQPHGLGQEGLAPPLAESDWVTGSENRLARVVLGGLRGPIVVKGKNYAQEMPPLGILEDQQIAAILTYIRREWGHTAEPVTVDFIKKVREESSGRDEPWTDEDLNKAK